MGKQPSYWRRATTTIACLAAAVPAIAAITRTATENPGGCRPGLRMTEPTVQTSCSMHIEADLHRAMTLLKHRKTALPLAYNFLYNT
jgi:hypothetical protein